jgi:hypothetical protein
MTRAAFFRTTYLILWRARVKHELIPELIKIHRNASDFDDFIFGRARSASAPRRTAQRSVPTNCRDTSETIRAIQKFQLRKRRKRDRQSLRTRGRLCHHADRVRSPDLKSASTVSVGRRVLRLRRVSGVRRLRRLDYREDLHPEPRGFRVRRMIRDDSRVLCEVRQSARL